MLAGLGLGVAELAIIVFVIATNGFVVAVLVSALRQPERTWGETGRSRATWVLLLLLFNWLAAVAYLLRVRPALRRAAEAADPTAS